MVRTALNQHQKLFQIISASFFLVRAPYGVCGAVAAYATSIRGGLCADFSTSSFRADFCPIFFGEVWLNFFQTFATNFGGF